MLKSFCILTRPLTTHDSPFPGKKERLCVPSGQVGRLCLLVMTPKRTKTPEERRRALVSLLAEVALELMLTESKAPPPASGDAVQEAKS